MDSAFFTYSLVFAQDVPFSMTIKINAFILVSLTLSGSFYLISVYCIYVYHCYIDIYKLKIECNIFSLLSSKELLKSNKIFSLALNTYWINIASYLVLVTYHGMLIKGYPNIISYIIENKADDKSLASIWILYIGILIIGYFLFSFCPSKIIINKTSHVKALMIRKLCKEKAAISEIHSLQNVTISYNENYNHRFISSIVTILPIFISIMQLR